MPLEVLPKSRRGLPADRLGNLVNAVVCFFESPLRSQQSQMNQPLMRGRAGLPQKLSGKISWRHGRPLR